MRDTDRLAMRLSNRVSIFPIATRRSFLAAIAACAVASSCGGCALLGGAFRPSNPEADRRAANQASRDALKELERLAALNPKKKLVVCFIGATGGSNAGTLSDATREYLDGREFRLIDKDAVKKAFKESGVRANNVFIPAERKKFADALGEDLDYILAGYVETTDASSEDGEESRGKRRVYKLELVDLETNEKREFVADL